MWIRVLSINTCVTTVRKKLLSISFSVALLLLIDGSPWVLFGGENLSVHQKILQARTVFGLPFFMEIFLIGAWCIWKQRNEVIFYGKPPHLAVWKANFMALVLDHFCRFKSSLLPSIRIWLSAL
jgi:hypothetical protein